MTITTVTAQDAFSDQGEAVLAEVATMLGAGSISPANGDFETPDYSDYSESEFETTSHLNVIEVVYRGVSCEVEATHAADATGKYTQVYVSTFDGLPMCDADVEGHLSAAELFHIVNDLVTGQSTGSVEWRQAIVNGRLA